MRFHPFILLQRKKNIICGLFLVSWDPKIFHHLPASALRGKVRTVPHEGGQLIEVAWTQVPPCVGGRDPEHGPEEKMKET